MGKVRNVSEQDNTEHAQMSEFENDKVRHMKTHCIYEQIRLRVYSLVSG